MGDIFNYNEQFFKKKWKIILTVRASDLEGKSTLSTLCTTKLPFEFMNESIPEWHVVSSELFKCSD